MIRSHKTISFSLVLSLFACFCVALFGASQAPAQPQQPALPSLPSFSALAKRVAPAVVNISSQIEVGKGEAASPFQGGDPFREFFEKFFGQMPERQTPRRSLGSGFIIDPSGYILTNSHVVEKSENITVRLADEREFQAKVIGRDPKTDLALIKISVPAGNLPFLTLGNSDQTEVGDWVVAVGNPFGLTNTVTHGIISAKQRVIGVGPYDNFLQTDAPVNPGNSGGPLLDLKGEVIGVTTAIVASGQSIGFAIPSSIAKTIVPQLREKGRVVRGFLGVSVQPVTRAVASALNVKSTDGALVGGVVEGGPAAKAGIKPGDIIVQFAGKPVKTTTDLSLAVAATPINTSVPVTVLRKGGKATLNVTVQETPAEKEGQQKPETQEAKGELGLVLSNITPEIQQQLGAADRTGVVVVEVRPGGSASEAGLRQGDIIKEVNQEAVNNVADFKAMLKKSKKGAPLLLLVKREDTTFFVAVERP